MGGSGRRGRPCACDDDDVVYYPETVRDVV